MEADCRTSMPGSSALEEGNIADPWQFPDDDSYGQATLFDIRGLGKASEVRQRGPDPVSNLEV